ncbi:hypothetical protein O9X90_07640 [Agrobacterium leguminum]|uniref:hypothetical protein n=1 Tax=Agrobacterium leguminum TaxID=2792015 RepID=UPI0022B8189B|nr:hypothetical protein [Agrobacterium leguminum]MCZ7932181.1 hypothetical protein [Agrobacterium leguminum]
MIDKRVVFSGIVCEYRQAVGKGAAHVDSNISQCDPHAINTMPSKDGTQFIGGIG